MLSENVLNYIEKGVFTARNIDLPKKVKYKARKRNGRNRNSSLMLIFLMEDCTQNAVREICLNGRIPFELTELLNSDKLLELLQLKKIEADWVTLTPALIKNRQR